MPAPPAQPRPVLIVGSGRSGTTWLSDEIARRARTRPVFEPLHVDRVPGVPAWGVRSGLPGPYLRPQATDQRMLRFVDRLLHGKIQNRWTRQDWRHIPRWVRSIPPLERLAYRWAAADYQRATRHARAHVIKLIKANLMLAWIDQNFAPTIVFVSRHPCKVVGSRLRLGWQHGLADVTSQDELCREWLEPYRHLIKSAQTPLQRHTVLWCVENLVPLHQWKQHRWHGVIYEECLAKPEQVFQRLDHALQLPEQPAPEITRRESGRSWHHPLTREEGKSVIRICQEFGIHLYGRDVMPQTSLSKAVADHRNDLAPVIKPGIG